MATKHTLTGPLEQARGVIGRYPAEDEEYVFEYDSIKRRSIHMVGVRRPLEVVFERDGEVVSEVTLRPWIGVAAAECDRIIERRPRGED